MLLAIDIGNTNIVVGISSGGQWIHQWRLQTIPRQTPEEYEIRFRQLFAENNLSFDQPDRVVISSVVPQLTPTICAIIEENTDLQPVIVDGSTDRGIRIEAENPEAVGSDLIADAVAAYDHYGESCLVVDFGTATTVMAVVDPGILKGGAICAGLEITSDALIDRAAQLSQISLEIPERATGRNTQEAMQTGLVLGHLLMVEGLIDRIGNEMNADKVIATGGIVERMAPHTDYFDDVDPILTLNGLRIIADQIDAKS